MRSRRRPALSAITAFAGEERFDASDLNDNSKPMGFLCTPGPMC
jgi:hypothetical protein